MFEKVSEIGGKENFVVEGEIENMMGEFENDEYDENFIE